MIPLLLTRTLALMFAAACFGPALNARADSPPTTDWRALAAEAASQLSSGLDGADRDPDASRKSLAAANASITRIIDSAPCSTDDLADLYFNRGLAHAASSDHAAALLDFLRSDFLRPSNAAFRQINAQRAALAERPGPQSSAESSQAPATAKSIDPPPQHPPFLDSLVRWMLAVPPAARWWSALALLAAFWILVGIRLLQPDRTAARLTPSLAPAAGAIGLLLLASVLWPWYSQSRCKTVVVLADSCTPRSGPDAIAYSASTFEGRSAIPRGTELCIVDQRDFPGKPGVPIWLQVRPRSDRIAHDVTATEPVWIPAESVGWVDTQASHPSDPGNRNG